MSETSTGPRRATVMSGGAWIAVAAAALVIAGVTVLAFQSARRDRAALVESFANDHLLRLRIAVREIESELDAVRQHLEFAARLVDAADSGKDQQRELDALLAVVRNYRLIIVYDLEGHERVVATDRGASSARAQVPYADALRETARAAMAGQAISISEPLGDAASPWYRAFGMPLTRNAHLRGAVVILLDQKGTFERLRLVAPERSARLVLLGPYGHPSPLTDPAIGTALESAGSTELREAARRMRAGQTGSVTVPAAEAAELGLGSADAVVVFTPIRTGDAGHWSVAIADSTGALQSQENAIVMRMALFAAVLVAALGSLSLYLVLSARKAIAVQERLRTAEDLLRAEKLATVGVLAAGIAHEVGTPLGVVRGRAEMLLSKLGRGSPQGEHARIMIDEIDRISRTIQELLDFSRPSKAPATAVALADVAMNVLGLLAFEARTRKVSMHVDVPPGLVLAANADQLKQVLVNLALNAVHACSTGGKVVIHAREAPDGKAAHIEVVDDGSGIPEDLRHRVFDPFFTTKKRGKGTGLGLTVAAQIIRSHGGDIELESAAGEGTRVRVSWPLASVVGEAHGQAERRAHSGGR